MVKFERDEPGAAHIADVAAAAGDPATKAEYDAFAVKFNAVLLALENAGLLKTA